MSKTFPCDQTALFANTCALAMFLVLGTRPAIASESVLYRFQGGNDGIGPSGALLSDASANLFGTTVAGGDGTGCSNGTNGCGTVFKLQPNGDETVLYRFKGGIDGEFPQGGLVVDGSGNLYGTTNNGGTGSSAGTVFRLAPNGTESVLYAFSGGSDGNLPTDNLIQDQNGNLYGTTVVGGNMSDCEGYGCGVVFKVDQSGNETVLYSFTGIPDGFEPSGGVISDGNGNLYGETENGGIACAGDPQYGCGTVFKLTPDGTESVLYAFQGGNDGYIPEGGLSMDQSGNLFGTTVTGGGSNCGCGTVFKVSPDRKESVLYAFKSIKDGSSPLSGVIPDNAGNLYGITLFGGGGTGCNSVGSGCGTAFEIKPDGTKSQLFAFKSKNGYYPAAPLLLRRSRLYGTASGGGAYNDGVVFSVTK